MWRGAIPRRENLTGYTSSGWARRKNRCRFSVLIATALVPLVPLVNVEPHRAAVGPGRAWSHAALAQSALPAALPADLDAYVSSVLTTFEVPGLALAVVKDGKVVAAKGYGVRRLGDSSPVDAGTLFGIASNTKVFTAVALGLLVEEGKIGWDVPVITYLPWFRLSDPYVTRELTVRDLLVHRSGLGLGAGDLLWWPESTYDRKEIARRLKDLPLSTSFRSAYAYDNVLYLIAGEVIEAISGQSWEDFVAAAFSRRSAWPAATCGTPAPSAAATWRPHTRR